MDPAEAAHLRLTAHRITGHAADLDRLKAPLLAREVPA
jgi:hypothetical protein